MAVTPSGTTKPGRRAEIAAALRGGLCKLAEHHQLRQRRNASDTPFAEAGGDAVNEFRCQLKRKTLVTARVVVVRAHVLVVLMADQHCAGDKLDTASEGTATEAPPANIGNRMVPVRLPEGAIARLGGASIIEHEYRSTVQGRYGSHRVGT
jgi:hypothetical protein